MSKTDLAADLLGSIPEISLYIFGDDGPSAQRRVRHRIAKGSLPAKKVCGRIESRKSWIDALYSAPDQPNGKSAK